MGHKFGNNNRNKRSRSVSADEEKESSDDFVQGYLKCGNKEHKLKERALMQSIPVACWQNGIHST
jgi:hypothetical protein